MFIYFARKIVFAAVVLGVLCVPAWGGKVKNIKIWVNAFIPRTLPGTTHPTPTFIVPAGVHKDKTSLKGPPLISGFFLTDQRFFSSVLTESSRMHHEVTIEIDNNRIVSVLAKCDPTIEIDPLDTGTVKCSQAGSAADMKIEDISISADKLLFSFKYNGAADNPCVTPSPDIDWSIKIQAELEFGGEGGRIKVSGLVDEFPAYEMYASVDGGPPIKIFNISPEEGKTPWNLIGNPTVRIEPQPGSFLVKEFGSLKNGNWQSNDTAQRFRLSISDQNVTWTEKNGSGVLLSRNVSLGVSGTNWRIERPNDSEVLRHLGFQPNIIPAIIALNPRPSFIVFTMKDGKLSASWNGLVVIKNPDGSVKELVQPGVRPPAQFVFDRQ